MKKGFWNYTDEISYKVIMVRLQSEPDRPMHWQNAFVGRERQVVFIEDGGGHTFMIDNQDGTGLLKIANGGGPDSYSAHVGNCEVLDDVPENEWLAFDNEVYQINKTSVATYQETNHPEEFARMQSIMRSMRIKQEVKSRIVRVKNEKVNTVAPSKRKAKRKANSGGKFQIGSYKK